MVSLKQIFHAKASYCTMLQEYVNPLLLLQS